MSDRVPAAFCARSSCSYLRCARAGLALLEPRQQLPAGLLFGDRVIGELVAVVRLLTYGRPEQLLFDRLAA
ncbi:MAG: hypothetical protein QOE41_2723 [Mycobacterium sp.]|jgi:hypothetical protein|nr:hypothetical protein [Mycobacterium sp.]